MSEMGEVLIKHPLSINCLLNTPVIRFKNLKEMTYKILLNKMLFPMKTNKFMNGLKNIAEDTTNLLVIFFGVLALAELALIAHLFKVDSISQCYVYQLEGHIEQRGVSVLDTDGETDVYQDYYRWH